MSIVNAERFAMLGGSLLLGALVASAILYFWPERERPATTAEAESGAAAEEPPEESPEEQAAALTSDREYERELARLRERLAAVSEENELLKGKLEEAGIPLDEVVEGPAATAAAAIEELRACGQKTPVADIEALVGRIVLAGPEATKAINRYLDSGHDVTFTPNWIYLDGRFVGYPTLRVALLECLARIGGSEGRAALVNALRGNDRPLEICLAAAELSDARKLAFVDEALLDAALRYLDLPPPRSENIMVRPVLEILLGQEPPEAAAKSLLRFVEPSRRRAATAVEALRLLPKLPGDIGLTTLVEVARNPALGTKSAAAARVLAIQEAERAVPLLEENLAKWKPAVRREVYISIGVPVERAVVRARREKDEGEVRAAIETAERELARRRDLLDRQKEPADPDAGKALESAKEQMRSLAERVRRARREVLKSE